MLTDTKIKSLKPQEKIYRVLDAERLYLEVRPTGAKVWRLKFLFEGKEGSISLGMYPHVSLQDARQLKVEILSKLAKGIHPVQDKREKRLNQTISDAMTFKFIAEEYINERLRDKSDYYKKQFVGNLTKDVYPVIGAKDINTVTSADILLIMQNTIQRIRKQSKYGRGEVSAIQNRKFVGAIIRYAIATLRCSYDPTYAVRDAVARPDIKHARPLTKQEQSDLIIKLKQYRGSETVKRAGLVMLYTMLRSIEIRRMTWENVDFETRCITFLKSDDIKKRTMKMNRTHIVPMSDQVFELLKTQYEISQHRDYVFHAVYKQGMLSATTLNRMLDYIGLSEVTAHDFRATASTLLNELGYEEDWIEKQLAHAPINKVRASYNHARYLADRRKMLQDWADIVDGWAKID